MNRRVFLRMTALAATAGAGVALAGSRSGAGSPPSAARSTTSTTPSTTNITRLTVPGAGTYKISGRVRLDSPRVDISGLTYGQSISWSGGEPTTTFTAFETFDSDLAARAIAVRGGHIESITAELLEAA